MKKIIALVLCLAVLLACAAAPAETEKESMGILKVNRAFDIRYSPLPDHYTLSIARQDDMMIVASIESTDLTLPRMSLFIAFNDGWADVERLNDVSEEDLQIIRNLFSEEYPDLKFDMTETLYGTRLLTVEAPSGQDAYVYTIYKGHEIEIHLSPGIEQDVLTESDLDRVVAFLSDMDFIPVEE